MGDGMILTLLMSFVKTPDASPYSVLLALLMTPSTSLHEAYTYVSAMISVIKSAMTFVSSARHRIRQFNLAKVAYPFSKEETTMTGPKDSSSAINM